MVVNEDVSDVYLVPQRLREEGLDTLVCDKLGLPDAEADLGEWDALVERIGRARRARSRSRSSAST